MILNHDGLRAEAVPGRETTVGSRAGLQHSLPGADSAQALAWHAQSQLLRRPDADLIRRLDVLRQVSTTLDERVGKPLLRFIDYATATPVTQLAAEYAATFDPGKSCSLCLAYYAYGNARKRGMALLRLEQIYAAGGLRLTDDEMPDHVAVMLTYAATAPQSGAALLDEHRAGLQLLRLALRDSRSPWADVVDSVWATLPPLTGDQWLAVVKLAALAEPFEARLTRSRPA
jgi:nitrate reductase delta subunit